MTMRKTGILAAGIISLCLAKDGFSQSQTRLTASYRDGIITVAIKSPTNNFCELQYADDINGPWQPLTNVFVSGNSAVRLEVSLCVKSRFFRCLEHRAGPDLVWILAGTFAMGARPGEQDSMDFETPQMTVTLTRSFFMSKYQVTQRNYLSLMGTNTSYFYGYPDNPVDSVPWEDAVRYCTKLTEREKAAGRIPDSWEYRLPTEAEWEYAARAGTTTRFSFGDDPNYAKIDSYAWYWNNTERPNKPTGGYWPWAGVFYTTRQVGTKLPNPWGLYDMYGNVWEWCLDWFGPYPGGTQTDPKGPASGPWHSFRGGCWYNSAAFLRSASRAAGNGPSNFIGGVGFRTVLAPK